MRFSLLLVVMSLLGAALVEAQTSHGSAATADVRRDRTVLAAPSPAVPQGSKDPFAALFKRKELAKPERDARRPTPRPQPKNPIVECGLLVWHVDASADPHIRVETPKTPNFTIRRVAPPPCDR